MKCRILVTAFAIAACSMSAMADLDMAGWTQDVQQSGMVWHPGGSGYHNDGYGGSYDSGHWGQASGGYDYSVNNLSVWSRGDQVRVVVNSGMRWKGNSNFIVGDLAIDTNGDGLYDAALLKPDLTHNQSSTDFTTNDQSSAALMVNGLTADDWRDVHYTQFPNTPWAVKDANMTTGNRWNTGTVTFDYDYRAAGAPDSNFYSATAGDNQNLVNKKDYLYSWTFDSSLLPGGFNWTQMHIAIECGNDGIDLVNPVPAPGAALLGILGISAAGAIRRRFA